MIKLAKNQFKDLEEFLKDLANSKRKMDIPSSDKLILKKVVSSLPTGIDILERMWEEKTPENYYEDLIKILVVNLEVNESLETAKNNGDLSSVFSIFIGIENKLNTYIEVFRKYLSEGIKWWMSQNNIT